MNIKEAVAKTVPEKGYFLVSAFTDEKLEYKTWTLMFYRRSDNTVLDFKVGIGAEKGDVQPTEKEFQELNVDDMKISAEEAVNSAKGLLSGTKPTAIYISANTKDGKTTWTISFILPDISAAIYDLDAKTGEIIKQDRFSLLRKIK